MTPDELPVPAQVIIEEFKRLTPGDRELILLRCRVLADEWLQQDRDALLAKLPAAAKPHP